MGAPGKALKGHGKRRKTSSPQASPSWGGYGQPPHPLRVISGQRYWPRTGKRKMPFVVTKSLKNGEVSALKLDGSDHRVALKAARLLAVTDDYQGVHYRFVGFTEERRYRTWAFVAEITDARATLVLPEWHPARPVSQPARLLPDGAGPGTWMTCTADLGQATGARLNVADMAVCADPGRSICHQPALLAKDTEPPPPVPECGKGCGDIVVELTGTENGVIRGGLLDVFITERAALQPGARIYLTDTDTDVITRYVELADTQPTPNGMFLRCHPDPCALAQPVVFAGNREHGHWSWRWWPRSAESSAEDLARYRYDAIAHTDDYVLTHRFARTGTPEAA